MLCRPARSANCLSHWHRLEPAPPCWVHLLFLETEWSLISVKARRSIGSQELFFSLWRQNFAPVTGCCSHFQSPAGSEPCFSWIRTRASQLLIIIRLIQRSDLLLASDTHPNCILGAHQDKAVVSAIFSPCFLHLESMCVGRGGAVVHCNRSPSGPPEIQACMTQHPASQSIPSQSSHSAAVWWLSWGVLDPQGQTLAFFLCFKQVGHVFYLERLAIIVVRKTIWERSFEYRLFTVKIKYQWKKMFPGVAWSEGWTKPDVVGKQVLHTQVHHSNTAAPFMSWADQRNLHTLWKCRFSVGSGWGNIRIRLGPTPSGTSEAARATFKAACCLLGQLVSCLRADTV